jgi:hypothetical protein
VDGGLVGAGVGAVAGATTDAAWEAGVHFCRGLLSTVFFIFLSWVMFVGDGFRYDMCFVGNVFRF